MKVRVLVLAGILSLPCVAIFGGQPQATQKLTPRFEDYPVAAIFRGKPAVPTFPKGQGSFRTRITEGAAKGPNFAGHFIIVVWGCGSGCNTFAVVDAISGRWSFEVPFVGLGIPYMGTASGREYEGLMYRLNSSLLIADGCPEYESSVDAEFEKNCGTRYYRFDGKRFELIATVSVPPMPRR